jgi:SLOG cluster4 family
MSESVIVGITGTRDLHEHQERAQRALAMLCVYCKFLSAPTSELVTGACTGVDALAARTAKSYGFTVHTIVPADRSKVDPDWTQYCTTSLELSSEYTYKDRNRLIVKRATCLFAMPLYAEDDRRSLRSGTWQTVRLARAKHIPIIVYQLNGAKYTCL